jgi:hypothetical protein
VERQSQQEADASGGSHGDIIIMMVSMSDSVSSLSLNSLIAICLQTIEFCKVAKISQVPGKREETHQ